MRAAALLLLLLPGACDRVFGLDRGAGDAAVDGAPQRVTGRFTYRYVSNDASGMPVEQEQAHPDVMMQVVFGSDVDPTAVLLDADGRFSFDDPGGAAYRLQWSSALDGNIATEFPSSMSELQLASLSAGRPTRVPVTQPTVLTFTPPAVLGTRVVLTTGIWTETGIAADSLDWVKANAASPPLGLLSAAEHDHLYYVVREQFTDAASGGTYIAYASDANAAVTTVDGMGQPVSLAHTASLRDQCTKLVANRVAMMQRVKAAAQPGMTVVGDDWLVMASPGSTIGPVGSLVVAYASEATATNSTITVMYRNPFKGHQPIAEMGGFYARDIKAPSATTAVSIPTGVRMYTPVMPCPAQNVLTTTQGIPGVISLGGTQLTAPDGTIVTFPANGNVALEWGLAQPGPVDLTTVTLYEVRAEPPKTVIVPMRAYKTTTHSVMLDGNTFAPQTQYIVRLDANIGMVNAATGDLSTVQYPYGNATQWSNVFGVNLQ